MWRSCIADSGCSVVDVQCCAVKTWRRWSRVRTICSRVGTEVVLCRRGHVTETWTVKMAPTNKDVVCTAHIHNIYIILRGRNVLLDP